MSYLQEPVTRELAQRQPLRYRPGRLDTTQMARYGVLRATQEVAVARAYKILRTRVMRRLDEHEWCTVGVTGTTAGEGKTFAAINLAMALAEDVSTQVFLVDLDLQRPKIAHYLGMPCTQGVAEYLHETASLDDIIYDSGIARLAIIPSVVPQPQESSELLRTPRMASLVQALRAEVPRRISIFDLPPLLASDDVLAFAPQVDSFLLIVSQGLTARRSVRNARELLEEMNLLGVVLNRSTEPNDSRYY